ncbi:MAG: hypothetical protein VXW06_06490, partial [Pseudomonadota bacterium]|nr:hypothetical protein [Pseudomonadota bacterium]
PFCHKTKLAHDSIFFTSQKLTLLAHGIAARLSQFAFSARKFDREIDGENKNWPLRLYLNSLN